MDQATQQKLIALAATGALVYFAYKHGNQVVKTAAVAVGTGVVVRYIPFVNQVA